MNGCGKFLQISVPAIYLENWCIFILKVLIVCLAFWYRCGIDVVFAYYDDGTHAVPGISFSEYSLFSCIIT